MPIATASQEGTTEQLKSLEGGVVILKRLTYGQKLRRLETASRMTLDMNRRNKDSVKGEMEMLQYAATLFDFQRCIVDHNLEKLSDPNDPNSTPVKLNFAHETDFVALDPKVGEEISRLIDKMNNFEDQEGNSDS